jgi:selenide, water dikinase
VETYKLTQFAKGAGCGCKIAPAVLEQILASTKLNQQHNHLLIGNSTNDDASVYDLQNGQALIITADFFMPIVDDAYIFGKVAAANAISDVYAMGGKPITAIAILGWPIDKLPAELAAKVLDGAREVCGQAGIIISGGHTIDSAEPFFGLSVNGLAPIENIKANNTANEGDLILLTKPIGVGILATAQKRGLLKPEHETVLIEQLTTLNSFGEILGKEKGVTGMTDVTGFGLLGHLMEMCEGANLSAEINYSTIPKLEAAQEYAKQFIVPDATYRNWNAYGENVSIDASIDATESFALLNDPQTNGGLLICVAPEAIETIQQLAKLSGVHLAIIGQFKSIPTSGIIVSN